MNKIPVASGFQLGLDAKTRAGPGLVPSVGPWVTSTYRNLEREEEHEQHPQHR
jgi:hypothetical protein